MAQQGTAIVNFGTGALDATVVVTGQTGIAPSSYVEAWAACNDVIGASTPDDSAWVDQLQITATRIVAGTGFTIVAKPMMGMGVGQYKINWIWN